MSQTTEQWCKDVQALVADATGLLEKNEEKQLEVFGERIARLTDALPGIDVTSPAVAEAAGQLLSMQMAMRGRMEEMAKELTGMENNHKANLAYRSSGSEY